MSAVTHSADEVLFDLDRQYPGLRFRVVDEQGRLRKHMKVFVNDEATRDLGDPIDARTALQWGMVNRVVPRAELEAATMKLARRLSLIAPPVWWYVHLNTARMGGEEFLVICPGTPLEGAAQLAERIRAAVEANVVPTEAFTQRTVTVSLGVSCSSVDGVGSIDTLIKSADEAVYQAKRLGRNRVAAAAGAQAGKKSA